ncbi:MAG: site-specific integrase [Bacteroides sp.]|nr:site-specific integrase [Bacteroides sp.]
MATVKVKYRPSTIAEHKGRIYYQIIHERKTRQLLTDYRLFPDEWNESTATVICRLRNERYSHLSSLRARIKCDLERFERIIRRLEEEESSYSSERIIEEFKQSVSNISLFNEMEKAIARLTQNGKTRTSQTYATTLRSFRKYRHGSDILLEALTSDIMEEYQAWLKQKGLTQNTISFYIRILRAVYNRALEEELIENRHPFRHVYTGVDKTVKRALPLSDIKRIKQLDLTDKSDLAYARDMFLLSFMLRGMSFIDMAYLKKSDLCNGYITYRRKKTQQLLKIAWTPAMQRITDRYPQNKSEYLLPIIRKPDTNERFVFKNAGEKINKRLKKIAELAGITIPLSMYVARHSWASIAKAEGIPLSVISEGLGHEKESTTRIYLSTLDTSAIDNANDVILNLL